MQQPNPESATNPLPLRLALSVIGFYRHWISPVTAPRCRYEPTCSSYAVDALQRFGLISGMWLAVKRLCRCHPWAEFGYDPCPQPADPATKSSGLQSVNAEETL